MPMFGKTEVVGQDLLAEYQDVLAAAQAHVEDIAARATDRAEVVESRLQELEAEKQVLNQLNGAKLTSVQWDNGTNDFGTTPS